jgi:hypothetical protein
MEKLNGAARSVRTDAESAWAALVFGGLQNKKLILNSSLLRLLF